MKTFLSLFATILFLGVVQSQPIVYYRSGNIVNTIPEKNPTNSAIDFKDFMYDGKYYLWLQFNKTPIQSVKENLLHTGVVLYGYLPSNTYIASFPANYNFNLLSQYNVYAVCKPLAAYKIDAKLFTPNSIAWAIDINNKLKVSVSFTKAIEKANFIASLQQNNIQFNVIENFGNDVISVSANMSEIQKIASHPLVQYIEPISAPGVIEDIQGISNHRITAVQTSDNWSNGKKLDGTGVVIGLGDNPMMGTHIDFTGRLLSNTSATTVPPIWHSDHCAGIITSAGNLDPLVRGQARGANLKVYNYYEPYTLFPGIYDTNNVRIISHSLGQYINPCNLGYDNDSRTNDELINTYPSLMYVHSAGNSGGTSCGGLATYSTITGGYKSAKNVITVGNLSKLDVIDGTSSRGPLPDGRLKPEVSAVGSSVNSTQPNNTFVLMSGTSMACPAVAGDLAVLYQAYKNKNGGVEPEGSLIKTILMNTADDLGNVGPDFSYGYGRVNVRKAVKAIENVSYFKDSINNGVNNTHTIAIPANVASVKVMVYWADIEATAGAAPSLVNNLDAKMTSADLTTTYLPWKLNIGAVPTAASFAATAIKGIDSINNIEQIQIDNPVAGNYTLTVAGTNVPTGPQKYYVEYEYTYVDEIVVTYPIGGESFVTGESEKIRWDASKSTANFTIQYSTDASATWKNISTTVAAARRYFDWTVPTTAQSKSALIKITRGTAFDVSDTSFVILNLPANIAFTDVCKNTTQISWTGVTAATEYDVFRLESKYMQLAGTTTATNIVLQNQDANLHWYAVRAKLAPSNANGRLTKAVSYTNSSTLTCPLPVKLISFNAALKNNTVALTWIVASEDGMMNYIVEKSTTPNFENIEIAGQAKPTNSPFQHQYQLNDNNLKSNTTLYYRLKMVEQSKSIYSNIQSVKINKWANESFVISPNPAQLNINLVVNKIVNSKNIVVKIYNELGIEVVNKNILDATSVTNYNISLATLSNGNYFVNIIDAITNEVLYKQQLSVVK